MPNGPDKRHNKLSKTEREIGGIPNTSEDKTISRGCNRVH